MKLFEGQTAIISGGLGDIGRAIARAFARGGANIALGDVRPQADAGAFLKELSSLDVGVTYTVVDVTNARDVERWVTATQSSIGTPTLVIVNAAIVTVADLLEIGQESWLNEINVNLNGGFYLAQSAANQMMAVSKRGSMVFVGSWAAHAPHANIPAYCVAKAGLRMLSRMFALRLAAAGIVVNEIAPGFVDAGLSGKAFDKDAQLKQEATAQVPVKLLITADEVSAQVLHLCHPDNRHITGSTLLIDGGLSLTNASQYLSTTKRHSDQ